VPHFGVSWCPSGSLPPSVSERFTSVLHKTMRDLTITTFGGFDVKALNDFGMQIARIETESVEGTEINLLVPFTDAPQLIERLSKVLEE